MRLPAESALVAIERRKGGKGDKGKKDDKRGQEEDNWDQFGHEEDNWDQAGHDGEDNAWDRWDQIEAAQLAKQDANEKARADEVTRHLNDSNENPLTNWNNNPTPAPPAFPDPALPPSNQVEPLLNQDTKGTTKQNADTTGPTEILDTPELVEDDARELEESVLTESIESIPINEGTPAKQAALISEPQNAVLSSTEIDETVNQSGELNPDPQSNSGDLTFRDSKATKSVASDANASNLISQPAFIAAGLLIIVILIGVAVFMFRKRQQRKATFAGKAKSLVLQTNGWKSQPIGKEICQVPAVDEIYQAPELCYQSPTQPTYSTMYSIFTANQPDRSTLYTQDGVQEGLIESDPVGMSAKSMSWSDMKMDKSDEKESTPMMKVFSTRKSRLQSRAQSQALSVVLDDI
jgi:hypothetical protein